MIKAKINNITSIVTFYCPECDEEDIVYMTMPEGCYKCSTIYNFLLNKMIEYCSYRKYYHFISYNNIN
jgi:hypothetical protein